MNNAHDQPEFTALNWQKVLGYLIELRQRLLKCLIVCATLSAIFLYFVEPLYHLLLIPFNSQHTQPLLLATTMSAIWLVPFKMAFMLALIVGMPYYLYQLWQFVLPALYSHERKQGWWLLSLSCGLFYLGMLVAYFVVLPLLYQLMLQTAPVMIKVMPELNAYVMTTLQVMWAFGLMFQLPIVMMVLFQLNWLTQNNIATARPYVIVGAFIIGMILAPPDVVSQTLFALPLCGLFEIGSLWVKFLKK